MLQKTFCLPLSRSCNRNRRAYTAPLTQTLTQFRGMHLGTVQTDGECSNRDRGHFGMESAQLVKKQFHGVVQWPKRLLCTRPLDDFYLLAGSRSIYRSFCRRLATITSQRSN